MKEYLYLDSDDGQSKFRVCETPKIDYLIKEKRFHEALEKIDQLLNDDYSCSNLNLKGIILSGLSEFEKAIATFDNALKLDDNREVKLNKANALYDWAKVTYFPDGDYDKAYDLIKDALKTIPDDEDASEYYFLKAEILEAQNELVEAQKAYLIAYKEFDRLHELESQIDYLHNTDDVLINIVGSNFYNFTPEKGLIVDLIKDTENEHDPDAISVQINEKIVGYVANSDYTLIDEVKSASTIKNIVTANQKAEILFVYLNEYVIAKLI